MGSARCILRGRRDIRRRARIETAPPSRWSQRGFNRYGEADETMRKDRDQAFGIDPEEKRGQREHLAHHAHPQRGVNALRDSFPKANGRPPGVSDADEDDG